MKNLHTFQEFLNESLNEAAVNFIEDKGTLKTRIGNLKYEVKGGLDRGGDRGSYQIDADKLAKIIGSIDTKAISKILDEKGIKFNPRQSEVVINLTNAGLGYNGLSAIRPQLQFPVELPKDWPARENGHAVSRAEYAIYSELNKAFEKEIKGDKYWIQFASEYSPSYNSYLDPKDTKLTINLPDGCLA